MQQIVTAQPHLAAKPNVVTGAARRVDWPFRLLLLYIFIDYGRPMDQIPILRFVHPGMVIIILLCATWLFSSRKTRVRSPITTWFALFLGWMAALGPFAVNNYWALQLFVAIGCLFVAQLCMLSFVDDTAKMRRLYTLWVVLCLYLGLRGLIYAGRGGSAFLGDENDFCLLMDTMVPFSYFPLLHKNTWKRRTLFLLTLVIALGAVVASKSRGGFVGLLAVAAYCWWVSPHKLRALVLAGAGAIALLIFAGPGYWEEMNTIRDPEDNTRQDRLDSWKAGCRVFLDYPLGIGAGSYPFAVGGIEGNSIRYDMEFEERDRTIAGRVAHSMYFTLLPELGIPGTLFFVGFIVNCFLASRRVCARTNRAPPDDERLLLRDFALASEAGIVGTLSAGVFISVLYYPHIYYLSGFLAVTRRFVECDLESSVANPSPQAPTPPEAYARRGTVL